MNLLKLNLVTYRHGNCDYNCGLQLWLFHGKKLETLKSINIHPKSNIKATGSEKNVYFRISSFYCGSHEVKTARVENASFTMATNGGKTSQHFIVQMANFAQQKKFWHSTSTI